MNSDVIIDVIIVMEIRVQNH